MTGFLDMLPLIPKNGLNVDIIWYIFSLWTIYFVSLWQTVWHEVIMHVRLLRLPLSIANMYLETLLYVYIYIY